MSKGKTKPKKNSATDIEALQKRLEESENANLELQAELFQKDEVDAVLSKREERQRQLLESCPDPIVDYDTLGAVMSLNRAFEDTFGFKRTKVCGQSIDFIPDDKREEYREIMEKVHAGETVQGLETKRLTKFGMDLDVLLSAVPTYDKHGDPTGHVEFLQDITETKIIEENLKGLEDRYQSLLETLPDPIAVYDLVGGLSYMNTAFENTFGWSRKKFLGLEIDTFPDESLWENEKVVERALDGENTTFETKRKTQDGRVIDILASVAPYRGKGGDIVGRMEILKDISELKQAEAALRRAEETYRTIFENAVEGIFQTMPEGGFIKANPAMAKLLHYASPEELIWKVKNLGAQLYAESKQRDKLMRLLRKKGSVADHEIEVLRKDGKKIWISVSVRAFADEKGRIERMDGLAQDITERKLSEMELQRKATLDELTGLPNRFLFQQTFEKMFAQAKRSGEMLAVLFIDLDSFKPVNDTHGHHIGDALLKNVAERLKDRLRRADIAARLGGDEFSVLLWNVSGPETVENIARRIISSLSKPFDLGDGLVVQIGASIGGSIYPTNASTPEALLKKADEAMYVVKQKGKNNYHLAEAE